jgi:hypothetical protein
MKKHQLALSVLSLLSLLSLAACSPGMMSTEALPLHQTLPGSLSQSEEFINDIDPTEKMTEQEKKELEQEFNTPARTSNLDYANRSCPGYKRPAGHHDCWTAKELTDYVECEENHGMRNGVRIAASPVSIEEFIHIVYPYNTGLDRNLGDDPKEFRLWPVIYCDQWDDSQAYLADGTTMRGYCRKTYGALCQSYCKGNLKEPGCQDLVDYLEKK